MGEGLNSAGPWSEQEMRPIVELVSRRTGLRFPEARRRAVEETLQRARMDSGARDWDHFRQLLAGDARVFDSVATALTVNESYFFRDPAQFEVLRAGLLPRLASEPGPIRIWSAGCAAGQEPYSLAILADELGIADRCYIVGTDLARSRLAAAIRGRFDRWSLRGVSPEVTQRYFRAVDTRYELRASIRRRVEFRQLNLADPAAWTQSPAPVDVLLCRNVLIYFDENAIARIARRLIASLSARGRLLLGASDPPLTDFVDCRVEVTPAGLVYGQRGSRPVAALAPTPPAGDIAPPAIVPLADASTRSPEDDSGAGDPSTPRDENGFTDIARRESVDAPPVATAATVRELANAGQIQPALEACAKILRSRPTDIEVTYLNAMLLSQAGRPAEAAGAARRALYLDRSLILGHAALGVALAQLGDRAGAVRSLTTASDLLAQMSADETLPAGDDQKASRVRASVTAHLDLLTRQ